jgi:small subunit ribosomal protein S4
MAKSTTGKPKFKIQRSLGLELPGLGKAGALERRPYGPGVHGNKRKKISDYAVRMKEKQKLLYHYGLKEKQLVNYVKKSKQNKSRAWMDTLIITLESRLDNVVFRLNFAPSITAATQMVSHGQVLVNGEKINIGNFVVQKGDVVTLSPKGLKNQLFLRSLETPRMAAVPACYKVEKGVDKAVAKMVEEPLAQDIPFEFQKQLVTEFYWKVK